MELCPPLHLGVVAIEKEDFGSHSTKIANFILLLMSNSATNEDWYAIKQKKKRNFFSAVYLKSIKHNKYVFFF